MSRVAPLVLAALLQLLPAPAPAADSLLVTVGDVTPTTAVLWARGVEDGDVTVEVRPAGGGPARSAAIAVARKNDLTGKVTLSGLSPGTPYRYRLRSGSESLDGRFVTAPAPEAAGRVVFLWSGDLGGGGLCRPIAGGYPIFPAMTARRADFFLFVGDTIYADVPCRGAGVAPGADVVATSLSGFRARHRYNREDRHVQELFRSTSVYAIWDDHEVRNDFAGPTEPLMPLGRRAFFEYWPIAAPPEEPARLYRKFRWGRLLEVFILDVRQYRSPNTASDGPGKTMLGTPQRRWLLDNVSGSSAVWKVIVSTVPLSIPTGPRERRDSWSNADVYGIPHENGTGFATERDAVLRELRARGVKNLVFVAADVHHAELIRHQPAPEFSFHEFVAGPLSATQGRPRPLDEALGPRSLFARGGVNTFGEITLEPAHLTVRLIAEGGELLFSHTVGPE